MPNWTKVIAAKTALAQRGGTPSPLGANPRIPPGQKQVFDFPVLDLGSAPQVSIEQWAQIVRTRRSGHGFGLAGIQRLAASRSDR